MAYPDKPTGNYTLRDYDFAQADSKKIPMDEYLFKNGYKNAEESDTESVPDAHSQNWLFDLLHKNLKYAVGTADENKRILAEFKLPIDDVVNESEYPLSSGGAYTNLVRRASSTTGTGSANQPVYIKADGQVALCNTLVDTATAVNYVKRASTVSATGSPSQGVYVDANGNVAPCNPVVSYFSSTSGAPINGIGVLEMLKIIYPVGSIYITTAGYCPLASLFGTWQFVGGDRVLQGAGTWGAGAEVPQGLPDIWGRFQITGNVNIGGSSWGGAFAPDAWYAGEVQDDYRGTIPTMSFYASRSNSTYTQPQGRVQPYAYVVNIWRRTS